MKLPQRFSDERSEAGETLLEVLMSSALMAVAVVGIIGALATTVIGSAVHRDQATGNTVLVAAVEALKSPSVTRVQCATATQATYLTAARSVLPVSYPATSLSIESIAYQNIGSSGGSATVSFGSTCEDTGPGTPTLQLITLRLTVPGERATPSVSFVKGDD